jgi:flavin-dependent dehydrogenase
MTQVSDRYDVVVVGGGPAGATVATLVAAGGHRALLLEREETPPFKVGESLMPATYWIFQRLGMLERLRASAFPRKHSVQFFGGSGRASAPFYFSEFDERESAVTWQILRSDFDAMMLDNARDNGADVVQGAVVRDVLFEGDRATGVRARMPDGQTRRIAARVTVDATGQSAFLARRLKMAATELNLKKASIYTHFAGARRDEGIDEGATLILHTRDKDSWFWYIPLPDDRVSVGVVGDLDYLLQSRANRDPQAIFAEELDSCAALKERLAGARQLFPMKVTKDFSYRADRVAGDGWVLVGDAFGFLDPVYSSGVLLALKSGELAADTIGGALSDGDLSAARLGSFGPEFTRGMEAVRKLVYAFYTKEFSFADFLKAHPECKQGIVDILSGNIYDDSVQAIFEPMGRMCPLPEDLTL